MDYLSRIGIFVEVARQESFAAAARELGITSSAVSKQIQNLEYELQAKLLTRTTRKVSLTEEGALFLDKAGRALEDIAEAKEQINELKATPRGHIRISVPSSLGVQHLKTPLAEFAATYPEVSMDVQFEDRMINIVEEGFDMAIRVGTLTDSSLIARKFATTKVLFCASPAYLEKYGTPQTPMDLAKHNVFAYTRNKGAHEWRYQDPDGQQHVIALHSRFRCDTIEMMSEGALHSLGIFAAPCLFVRPLLEEGKLVSILNEYKTVPERGLYAIFPPNRYLSTRLRLLVDHLDAYCIKAFG
jgi:DNA-binding transcriptional LysR family regulator